MKKIRYYLLLVLLLGVSLAALGCGAPKLSKPSNLRVDEATLTLSWSAVPNARYYTVSIDGNERDSRGTSYSLAGLSAGDYTIRVRARGNGEDYGDSGWSDRFSFTRESEPGFTFALVSGRTAYEVTGMGTAGENAVVPAVYRGKPVTRIGDRAFSGKNALKSVVLPDSVTYIGTQAFYACSQLTSINIPASVTTIGAQAFQSCRSLATPLVLPENLLTVADNAFANCAKLPSVTFGEKVTAIGEQAFSDCTSLTSVTLPDSVTRLGAYAFSGCTAVESVTMGRGLTAIGDRAFYNCTKLTDIAMGENVTTIGDYAFAECKGERITLSGKETAIGMGAFFHTQLWEQSDNMFAIGGWLLDCKDKTLAGEVVQSAFPVGISAIGGGAFVGCNAVTAVILPDSVRRIGEEAFYHCKELSGVAIGRGTEYVGQRAFAGCGKLSTVYLGDTQGNSKLRTIDSYAFYGCAALGRIEIPASVQKIGTNVFHNSGIWNMPDTDDGLNVDTNRDGIRDGVIFAGTKETGLWAVGYNHTTTDDTVVGMPGGWGEPQDADYERGTVGIADYAFYNSAAVIAIIPNSVQVIGRAAFYNSQALSTVSLPAGLKVIDEYTFYRCRMLHTIELPTSLQRIERSAFYGCANLGTGPRADKDDDGNFVFTVPDGVTSIGAYAFYGVGVSSTDEASGETYVSGVAEIRLPAGLTSIGDNAFANCVSIRRVTVPAGVTSLGLRAFYRCTRLQTVTLNGVNALPERAFYGCAQLQELHMPHVTTVGDYAFYGCASLTEFPAQNVTHIGTAAFYGAGLRSFDFSGVTEVGAQAFRNNKELTGVLLSDTVRLGDHVFYGCNNLTVYTALSGKSENWSARWNSSYRPVVWNVTLASDERGAYVSSITVRPENISNNNSKTFVTEPYRAGYVFGGWSTSADALTPDYEAYEIGNAPRGTVLYAIWL